MGLTAWNTKPTRYYRHDRMLSATEWRDREKALADAQRVADAAEHRRATEIEHIYRCRLETHRRQRMDRLVLHTVATLAAFVLALAMLGQCDAQAQPAPTTAAELEARMAAWQPAWTGQPGELRTVAEAIVEGCRDRPWPSAERCPWLVAALAFRESSWRVDARGAHGEIGLVQVHGAALGEQTREAAEEPVTNVRLGLMWLRRAAVLCGMSGRHGTALEQAALSVYAGLRCGPSRGATLVLRWERELRGAR